MTSALRIGCLPILAFIGIFGALAAVLFIAVLPPDEEGDGAPDSSSDDSDSDEDSSGGSSAAGVAEGEIVETAMGLAWEDRVAVPFSAAPRHGEDVARPEYVEAAEEHADRNGIPINTAYFTDCGVYVATVIQASEVDPDFPARCTCNMFTYVQDSSKWETFYVEHEGHLEPGDILVQDIGGTNYGHIYFYTGEREDSDAPERYRSAVGASLHTRPPSGHSVMLTIGGHPYLVARFTG
ncbi:hypothetical protein [Nesterenkonia alkaliphila]|uniref:CHAP domain-containing protein n=1 Tax=Nesterenkonia alkaliphila TaxID=1463631 RepID=A0A7K1UIP3_9MICC|nr:hypothetical protein [Nesterenkonia alkaliphila]MVT26242.1 hypothetical protein [Nesterenkonia alkaliphila]GFZ99477.1 hypothetical protein GCM10011359_30570 [Nesterenkonia alkaliphila]